MCGVCEEVSLRASELVSMICVHQSERGEHVQVRECEKKRVGHDESVYARARARACVCVA